MVDSIKPSSPTLPIRRDQTTQGTESHGDDKYGPFTPAGPPLRERRLTPDRRKNQKLVPRSIYELRSGKDRRRSDGRHPSIEIEV